MACRTFLTNRFTVRMVWCVFRLDERQHPLPAPPDVAFVAVPGTAVIDAVRDLAQAGIGAAIVNSSGFAESGTTGARLES